MTTLNPAVARVFKRLHYPLDVILMCVRWYVAYPLSLRHIEEMVAERGICVDHSTVHRWALKLLPVLEKAFRLRKRPVGKSWRMDETYSTPSQRSHAHMGVKLLEHVWNAGPGGFEVAVPGHALSLLREKVSRSGGDLLDTGKVTKSVGNGACGEAVTAR